MRCEVCGHPVDTCNGDPCPCPMGCDGEEVDWEETLADRLARGEEVETFGVGWPD